ncbi:MAG: hypothetical protein JW757_08785 [Anaerolineales bacterium]|nr:hypothetical protein [Anaerolineales bacterium]
MSKQSVVFLLAMAMLLASCGTDAQPEAAIPSATPRLTNTATPIPTNTPEPTPTHTPTPTIIPSPTPTLVPAGREAISLENASQLEVLDWPIYGSVSNAFYATEDQEKLASVLMTRTHLVGYSLDGEYLYELPAPQRNFFLPAQELPSNFAGNFHYVALPSADETYTVEIYDLTTGQMAYQFDHLKNFPQAEFQQNEYGSSVLTIAFNELGTLMATAYQDTTLSIWELETGKEYSLPRTFQFVQTIAFSEDSSLLAISDGFWNESLEIFDITDFENIEVKLSQNGVGTLVSTPFSKGNKYLVTMIQSSNPKYAYFDLEKMEMVERAGLPAGTQPVFSEDGDYLIFQANWWADGVEMSAINLETRERTKDQEFIQDILPEEQGYWDDLQEMSYDQISFFSPREIRPYKNTFTAWDEWQYYTSQEMTDGKYQLAYWLLWETSTALEISLDAVPADEYISLTGKFGQSEDEIFYCLGTQLLRNQIGGSTDPVVLAENCAAPGVVAYDPGHIVVAYPVSNKVVEVINVASGETLFRLGGYTRDLAEIHFSPDGSVLVLKAEPNLDRPGTFDFSELMLFFLDYENMKAEAVPLDIQRKVFEDYVMEVAVTGDGSYLAAGVSTQDADKNPPKIYLWDFEGLGARRRTIYAWAASMTFSPDKAILAVSTGESFQLYAVTTSELLAEYSPPMGSRIEQLLFSQDGKSLFVLVDGAVSIWGVP